MNPPPPAGIDLTKLLLRAPPPPESLLDLVFYLALLPFELIATHAWALAIPALAGSVVIGAGAVWVAAARAAATAGGLCCGGVLLGMLGVVVLARLRRHR